MSANNTIQSSALPVGYVLRDHTITAVLGQGGFGITYLAKEDLTDYTVVIKENFPADFADRHLQDLTVIPRPGHDKNYSWSLESFVKEAQTLRNLPEHDNIVRIMTVFKELNTAYIVMKPVDGQNLDRIHPEGTMIGKSDLLHLLHKLLPALTHLHSHSIIHRDIKPANIMLTSAGDPVLIDFGAARPTRNAKTVTIIGTIGYAPPEQISQEKIGTETPPQPNWDIYALGATCYRLITGKNPTYSTSRLVNDDQLCSIYGAELLRSIDRARALDATERWQSAQEWLHALNATPETLTEPQLPTISQAQTIKPQQQTVPVNISLREARRLLKEQHITPNEYDNKLIECAGAGETEQVRLLIAAGADVNNEYVKGNCYRFAPQKKEHRKGNTPLCAAACKGHTECVKLLLATPGIDVNKGNNDGWTPLYWAVGEGRTECVKLLLATPGIDINKGNNDEWTPLARATALGQTECVKLLLAAPGIDVNKATNNGETPLFLTARCSTTECAKLLLVTPRIDINKGNNNGWTPLNWAAYKGHTECVKLLLTAPDIDVNKGNNDGGTPLSWAARGGHSECLKLLLDAPSIEVNSKNNTGKTPLSLAKKNRHTECVNLLIEAGANDWDRQECESTEPAPKPIPRPTQQISSPPAPESENNKGYGLILFYALGGAIIGGIIGAQIGNMGLGAIAGFFIGFIVATQLKN